MKLDKKEIIQKIEGQFNLEDIKFLIWCGNRKGRDVDLLVVLQNWVNPGLYKPSKWDIFEITKNEFERRLKLFDPVVTEPVSTGSLIAGDKIEFSLLKTKLFSSFPSKEAIAFLNQRALEELRNTFVFLIIYEQKKDRSDLIFALIDLSFACSYYEFAKYYRDNPDSHPISFAYLLKEDNRELLRGVAAELKSIKLEKEFNTKQIINLFEKTKNLLRGD